MHTFVYQADNVDLLNTCICMHGMLGKGLECCPFLHPLILPFHIKYSFWEGKKL